MRQSLGKAPSQDGRALASATCMDRIHRCTPTSLQYPYDIHKNSIFASFAGIYGVALSEQLNMAQDTNRSFGWHIREEVRNLEKCNSFDLLN